MPALGGGMNPYMMMGQMGASALGYGANYIGAKAGTDALMHEQEKYLGREQGFDDQRRAFLGQYLHDNFATPVGTSEAAATSDAARVASGAVNPGVAAAAGQSLGVQVPAGMTMNPNTRLAVRRAGAGQRGARMAKGQETLGSNFDEVERQRGLMETLEPMEQQRAAQTGSEWRQIGSVLIGLGGGGGGASGGGY